MPQHDNNVGKTPKALGQEAYLAGHKIIDNPYSRSDGWHDLWLAGWVLEERDHKSARRALIEAEARGIS